MTTQGDSSQDYLDLLQDQSLLRIWWQLNVRGWKGVRNSKVAVIAMSVVASLSLLFLMLSDGSGIAEHVRFIAVRGLLLVSGVLSFLLAGFVFLLSASNATLLYHMTKFTEKKTKLDYLRYNTFSLLALFGEFVAAAVVFSAIMVFGQPDGLFSILLSSIPAELATLFRKAAFFISANVFFLLVFRLKSFITNYYQFAMTSLVVAFDELDEEYDDPQSPPP